MSTARLVPTVPCILGGSAGGTDDHPDAHSRVDEPWKDENPPLFLLQSDGPCMHGRVGSGLDLAGSELRFTPKEEDLIPDIDLFGDPIAPKDRMRLIGWILIDDVEIARRCYETDSRGSDVRRDLSRDLIRLVFHGVNGDASLFLHPDDIPSKEELVRNYSVDGKSIVARMRGSTKGPAGFVRRR